MKSIHFQFRHGQQTVQKYIPLVCRAIYEALKDKYMHVSMFFFKNKLETVTLLKLIFNINIYSSRLRYLQLICNLS